MDRFEHWFLAANKWILVALLGAMSCIVFANVSLRYLTNFSITWSEEVARYLMIWMVFIGAGLALRHGMHVAISGLQEMLPRKVQQFLRVVIVILLLVFFAMMMRMGYDYLLRARFQLTPATRIPFSYIYSAMPIGFLLMTVHLLLVIRSYVGSNQFEPFGQEREADDPTRPQ